MSFPATYNIRYYKGDTYEFVIRPKTSAGDIYPVTSATYTADFRIATQRGGAAGTGIDGDTSISDNAITCTILPSVGSSLVAGTTYYYDVSITSVSDPEIVFTLLTGTISITADIATAP
jgi:hypothetical protein